MFSNLNPRRNQAILEASRRRLLEATYTTPLGLDVDAAYGAGGSNDDDADLQALRDFLHAFYPTFYDKSSLAKRQSVLDEYPEQVLPHYERLVKNGATSEEEFWQRYYYRCDPEQILLEWDRHPERGRRAMGEAVSNWFKKKPVVSNGGSSVEPAALTYATAVTGSTSAENSKSRRRTANISTSAADDGNSSKDSSRNTPASDSVSWFDAKWDAVKKAWVLPKEDSEAKGSTTSKSNLTTLNKSKTKPDEQGGRSGKSPVVIQSNAAKSNSNSPANAGMYVPPHKRGKMKTNGRKSTSKSNVNGSSSNRSKTPPRPLGVNLSVSNNFNNQVNGTKKVDKMKKGVPGGVVEAPTTTNDKSAPRWTPVARGGDAPKSHPTESTSHKKDRLSSLTIGLVLFLFCSVTVLLLALIPKEQICDTLGNSLLSSLLICLDEPPPMEMGKIKPGKKKKKRNKKVQFQTDDGAPSSLEKDHVNSNQFGQPNGIDGGNGGDGMVDNLISSWMQSVDMSQFLGGGMMTAQQQQQEQHSENSNNGIALLPYQQHDNNESQKKKKRGGPLGFFKRKFGRDRRADNNTGGGNTLVVNNNNHQGVYGDALVVNNNHQGGYGALSTHQQPQMVVHQHVHHVVHHVVHEYRD